MNSLETDFIGLITKIGRLQGMDELTGKVFGLLYMQPKEVSMDDIAKKTGYSLASISNKIKLLEAAGMVTRIKKPGSKKIYLYMDKNVMNTFEQTLIKKQQFLVKTIKEEAPEIIKKYDPKKLSEKELKELELIKNYHQQVLKLEVLFTKMLEEVKKLSR